MSLQDENDLLRAGLLPTDHREGTRQCDPPAPAAVAAAPTLESALRPRLITLEDARHPPIEQFLVGSLYPLGKPSVTFGPSGVGKSSLIAQLAFRVAAGGSSSFLGMFLGDHGPAPVLIYSAEDTLEDWQRKAGAILRGCPDIDVESALQRLYVIDRTEGIARLSEIMQLRTGAGLESQTRKELRATPERLALIACAKQIGAKFINLETASRLVEDEDNSNMAALLAAAGHIAAETGAAVNISHHPTKAASRENDSSPESARGGGAFIANSRTAVSLFPADEAVLAKLAARGLRFAARDVLELKHAKSTSSVPPQDPIVLVRCTTPYGGVLQLPELVQGNPEQAAAHAEKRCRADAAKADRFRLLYDVVKEQKAGGPLSVRALRDQADRVGVITREMDAFTRSAIAEGVLKIGRTNKAGHVLDLDLGIRP